MLLRLAQPVVARVEGARRAKRLRQWQGTASWRHVAAASAAGRGVLMREVQHIVVDRDVLPPKLDPVLHVAEEATDACCEVDDVRGLVLLKDGPCLLLVAQVAVL